MPRSFLQARRALQSRDPGVISSENLFVGGSAVSQRESALLALPAANNSRARLQRAADTVTGIVVMGDRAPRSDSELVSCDRGEREIRSNMR
jgi:hypothetical protein